MAKKKVKKSKISEKRFNDLLEKDRQWQLARPREMHTIQGPHADYHSIRHKPTSYRESFENSQERNHEQALISLKNTGAENLIERMSNRRYTHDERMAEIKEGAKGHYDYNYKHNYDHNYNMVSNEFTEETVRLSKELEHDSKMTDKLLKQKRINDYRKRRFVKKNVRKKDRASFFNLIFG